MTSMHATTAPPARSLEDLDRPVPARRAIAIREGRDPEAAPGDTTSRAALVGRVAAELLDAEVEILQVARILSNPAYPLVDPLIEPEGPPSRYQQTQHVMVSALADYRRQQQSAGPQPPPTADAPAGPDAIRSSSSAPADRPVSQHTPQATIQCEADCASATGSSTAPPTTDTPDLHPAAALNSARNVVELPDGRLQANAPVDDPLVARDLLAPPHIRLADLPKAVPDRCVAVILNGRDLDWPLPGDDQSPEAWLHFVVDELLGAGMPPTDVRRVITHWHYRVSASVLGKGSSGDQVLAYADQVIGGRRGKTPTRSG